MVCISCAAPTAAPAGAGDTAPATEEAAPSGPDCDGGVTERLEQEETFRQEFGASMDEYANAVKDSYLDYLVQTSAQAEEFGFASTDVMSDTTLGIPYPRDYITVESLDRVRAMAIAGSDGEFDACLYLSELQNASNIYWYPVMTDEESAATALMVAYDADSNDFYPGEFGGTETVQAIMSALAILNARLDGVDRTTYTVRIVDVPALRATFLIAIFDDRRLLITPAMVSPARIGMTGDERDFELRSGVVYGAESGEVAQVFSFLADAVARGR